MSKRSSKFERRPRDAYSTPPEAVAPLFRHLTPHTLFAEPCAGEGYLVAWLRSAGHFCAFEGDIERGQDAREFKALDCDYIITNPPWSRPLLHELIVHFSNQRPTWLLFDADWPHTKQAIPYMERCRRIVSVGRVSWMGNGVSGFDNCCWYLFTKDAQPRAEFYARAA